MRAHLHSRRRRAQLGLTLVELMVATTVGLMLTAGIIQVFLGNRATYEFNESLAWIQENARFAVDHMANHARMVGYAGCLADVAVVNNLDGAANAFRDDLAGGVQGFEYDGTGDGDLFAAAAMEPAPAGAAGAWAPALPDDLGNPVRPIPGSDAFIVRYVSGAPVPLVSPFSTDSELIVAAGHGFEPGRILVATDCLKASVFQLTGVTAAGGNENLMHAAGGGFTPGNDASAWGTQQSFGLGAEVGRLESIAFYVGQGDSGAPALYQLRLRRINGTTAGFEAEELIEGIDTMQLRYGLDTADDGRIDSWQTADAVEAAADWDAVVSMEISLLTRGDEEYGTETDTIVYDLGGMRFDPVDDRRLRQVFTTVVGLRNRLP